MINTVLLNEATSPFLLMELAMNGGGYRTAKSLKRLEKIATFNIHRREILYARVIN